MFFVGGQVQLFKVLPAALLCAVGAFSFLLILQTLWKHPLKNIKILIFINSIITIFYAAIDFFFYQKAYISILSLGLFFPAVFILKDVSVGRLHAGLYFIALITISGINHLESLPKETYYEIFAEHRGLTGDSPSSIFGIINNGGYLFSHHSASTILAMLISFFITNIYDKRSYQFLNSVFLLSSINAMWLTGAAANSLILISGLLAFILYKKDTIFRVGFVLTCVFLIYIIFTFFLPRWVDIAMAPGNLPLPTFLLKFHDLEHVYQAFSRGLSVADFLEAWRPLLYGFGHVHITSMLDTEFGFLKILLTLGVVPSLVLFSVIFSPIGFLAHAWKQKKYFGTDPEIQKCFDTLFFRAVPVLVGSMTLIHFGSLFKIDVIGVWLILFSIFLVNYENFLAKTRSL